MAVVIAVISVAAVTILVCIICIVRCIFRIQGRLNGSHQIANDSSSKRTYGSIIPEMGYNSFVEEVGLPFQNSCAICLQQFMEIRVQVENNKLIFTQTDQISKVEGQKKVDTFLTEGDVQYNENLGIEQNNSQKVKLTVCGHLLHSSCLDTWLSKEQTCPLCRQSLSLINLAKWEKLFKTSIQNNDWVLRNQQQSNIQASYNSLKRNKQQAGQQNKQKPIKLRGLINFYLTIMNFHKGESKISQNPKLKQQNFDEVNNIYFGQNNYSNHKKSESICKRESQTDPTSADNNSTTLNFSSYYQNHNEIVSN